MQKYRTNPTRASLYYYKQNNISEGSELINKLALCLLEKSKDLNLSPKIIGVYDEEIYTFQHPQTGIALISEVSSTYYFKKILESLYRSKCYMIFVNSFFIKNQIGPFKTFENDELYRPVQLQNIFSPVMRVESLINYQVDKFMDIVSMSLENIEEQAAAKIGEYQFSAS